MEKKITVTISGPNASGKTHIVAAIHDMLNGNGLSDKITLTGVDDHAKAYGDVMRRITCKSHGAKLVELLPNLSIELVEYYGDNPDAPKPPRQVNIENAKAYLEEKLWEFIDGSGNFPSVKVDPRIWEHVMVYAPSVSDVAVTVQTEDLVMTDEFNDDILTAFTLHSGLEGMDVSAYGAEAAKAQAEAAVALRKLFNIVNVEKIPK